VRHTHRVDGNQDEIVQGLRKAGCSVLSLTTLGQGVPDLLVARAGQMWLLEVKASGGQLRDSQSKFSREWSAPVTTVRSLDAALWTVGLRIGNREPPSSA
jgi:hypothetical protein